MENFNREIKGIGAKLVEGGIELNIIKFIPYTGIENTSLSEIIAVEETVEIEMNNLTNKILNSKITEKEESIKNEICTHGSKFMSSIVEIDDRIFKIKCNKCGREFKLYLRQINNNEKVHIYDILQSILFITTENNYLEITPSLTEYEYFKQYIMSLYNQIRNDTLIELFNKCVIKYLLTIQSF